MPILPPILSTTSSVKCSLNIVYLYTGITLSGLDQPLTVGQSTTIRCMTNIPVTSIEWRDQSSALLASATYNIVLEYTISLVTDNLQGQQFTCVAMAGATTYTETVEIQVEGRWSTY